MSAWRRIKRKGQEAKMGNQSSVCRLGHSHRSKLEAAVCVILQLRERAGEIVFVQVEAHVTLVEILGERPIVYIPDFKCMDTVRKEFFWVEAKGYETPEWRLKRKLWMAFGPGRLEVWKGNHVNPTLHETIEPRRIA